MLKKFLPVLLGAIIALTPSAVFAAEKDITLVPGPGEVKISFSNLLDTAALYETPVYIADASSKIAVSAFEPDGKPKELAVGTEIKALDGINGYGTLFEIGVLLDGADFKEYEYDGMADFTIEKNIVYKLFVGAMEDQQILVMFYDTKEAVTATATEPATEPEAAPIAEPVPVATAPATPAGQPKVAIDGKEIAFELPMINKNGFNFYPVSELFTALGAEVTWEANTKTAGGKLGDYSVQFVSGSKDYTVNGETKTMDDAAFIDNSRTYIPVRFAAEGLGMKVDWDAATSTINIVTTAVAPAEAPANVAELIVGYWIWVDEDGTLSKYHFAADGHGETYAELQLTDGTSIKSEVYKGTYTVEGKTIKMALDSETLPAVEFDVEFAADGKSWSSYDEMLDYTLVFVADEDTSWTE